LPTITDSNSSLFVFFKIKPQIKTYIKQPHWFYGQNHWIPNQSHCKKITSLSSSKTKFSHSPSSHKASVLMLLFQHFMRRIQKLEYHGPLITFTVIAIKILLNNIRIQNLLKLLAKSFAKSSALCCIKVWCSNK
jgi:hypothetical protein